MCFFFIGFLMGCLKGFPNDQGQALPVPKFAFTTEAPGPQRRDDGRSARPSVAAVGAGWSPRGDAVEKMVGLGRAFWKDGSTVPLIFSPHF
jgi:hypothetical protein